MVPRTLPELIETDLGDFRAALRGASLPVLDFETSDVRPRIAVSAGLGVYLPEPERVFCPNVGHARRDEDVPLWEPAALARVLRPIPRRRSNRVVMHNAPFDLRLLLKPGLDVRCRVSDTLFLTHRLDENLRSNSRGLTYHAYLDHAGYGLKELTLIYFNRRPPTLHGAVGPRNTRSASPTEVARYCAQDVVNTFNLHARAAALLAAEPGPSPTTCPGWSRACRPSVTASCWGSDDRPACRSPRRRERSRRSGRPATGFKSLPSSSCSSAWRRPPSSPRSQSGGAGGRPCEPTRNNRVGSFGESSGDLPSTGHWGIP
jgi:hypothetical protein